MPSSDLMGSLYKSTSDLKSIIPENLSLSELKSLIKEQLDVENHLIELQSPIVKDNSME